MKLRRLIFCIALSTAFASALAANPFPGRQLYGWRDGGVEFAVNIPIIAKGDIPRGIGFELNGIVGTNVAIGFFGLMNDWNMFGVDFYYFLDPLGSPAFMVPIKARVGYCIYYDEHFWGGTIGAGPSVFLGTGLASGTEMFAKADLMANLAIFSRSYFGSKIHFIPEGSVSWIGYFQDDQQL